MAVMQKKKKINKPQRKSRNIKMVAAARATTTTTTVNYAHILERTTTVGEVEEGGRGGAEGGTLRKS